MSVKIYVGNLPYSTTSEDLESLFQEKGEVESATVMSDRETGRSRGFGFVQMASRDEAMTAIEELNGAEYQGRTLTVNEARPREERPRSFGGGGGYGGGGGSRGGDRGGYGGRGGDRY